uniref:Uncharacterized protein n=1 Tax=Arundo donax TaxID=35708 RepID=A0A0A9AGG8_ARUDO
MLIRERLWTHTKYLHDQNNEYLCKCSKC